MRESLGKLIVAVFLAMIVMGCSAGGYEDSDGFKLTSQNCDLVLTPEPALLEMSEKAAEIWSAASPCNVTIGDEGVPVSRVRVMEKGVSAQVSYIIKDGNPGLWKVNWIHIKASVDPDYAMSAFMHEIWHALGGRDHVDSGLGASPAQGEWPDQLSIDEMCTVLVCD